MKYKDIEDIITEILIQEPKSDFANRPKELHVSEDIWKIIEGSDEFKNYEKEGKHPSFMGMKVYVVGHPNKVNVIEQYIRIVR